MDRKMMKKCPEADFLTEFGALNLWNPVTKTIMNQNERKHQTVATTRVPLAHLARWTRLSLVSAST